MKAFEALTIQEFREKIKQNFFILDTRNPLEFTEGFIPGSVSIGLEQELEKWAAILLPHEQSILLVTETGKERNCLNILNHAGIENIAGYLQGGFETWLNAGESIDLIINIEADELAMDLPFDENLIVVDVRTNKEYEGGHVKDSTNIPLKDFADVAQIASLEEDQNIYLLGGEEYSSIIAASILKMQGYHNLRNIIGGWNKIKSEENIPIEKSGKKFN